MFELFYHAGRTRGVSYSCGPAVALLFDQLDTTRIERHHVRRLEQLGFKVDLTPVAAA
jgi:hypothetical protein